MEGRISKLPLDKGNNSKKGHVDLPRERGVSCVRERGKEENECEENISFYVWKGVVHGKHVCKK